MSIGARNLPPGVTSGPNAPSVELTLLSWISAHTVHPGGGRFGGSHWGLMSVASYMTRTVSTSGCRNVFDGPALSGGPQDHEREIANAGITGRRTAMRHVFMTFASRRFWIGEPHCDQGARNRCFE